MQFGKLKHPLGTLLCALALAGCSPTPETVGNIAKTSIQEVLRVDPRFEGSGVEVIGVQLTPDGDRQYKGMARIRHKDVVHEVPVNVLVDGLSIKWSTTPDAFTFIPQIKPPQ